MSQYTDLQTAISADIVSAWGVTPSFGRPRIPQTTFPNAVVICDQVTRQIRGRMVECTWTFGIVGSFALPGSGSIETAQFARAAELTQTLTPYNEDDTVPSAAGAYGGVGYLPLVAEWRMPQPETEDGFYSVEVVFTVKTQVHQ